jgi:hypothetical protein
MCRQLVVMVVTVASMILIALLVPMTVLIQRFAFEDALAAASLEVHATETVVSFRERPTWSPSCRSSTRARMNAGPPCCSPMVTRSDRTGM